LADVTLAIALTMPWIASIDHSVVGHFQSSELEQTTLTSHHGLQGNDKPSLFLRGNIWTLQTLSFLIGTITQPA
jgi:hypothetical protein